MKRIDSAALFAANLSTALAQFGIVWGLTRVVPVEEVGVYAAAMAIATPVSLGVGLRLRVVRTVEGDELGEYRGYFLASILLVPVALIASTSATIVFGVGANVLSATVLLTLSRSCDFFSDLRYAEFQLQDQNVRLAGAILGRSLMVLACSGALLFATQSMISAIAGQLVGSFAFAIALSARQVSWREVLSRSAVAELVPIYRRGVPLGFAALVASASASAPRIISGIVGGAAGIAIFAVSAYPAIMLSLISNSIGQAHLSRLSRVSQSQGPAASLQLLRPSLILVGGLGAISVAASALCGEPFLRVFFGSEYASDPEIMTLMVAAAAMTGLTSLVVYVIASMRAYWRNATLQLLILAISVVIGYGMASSIGPVGAAIGSLVGASVGFAAALFLVALDRRDQIG